MSKTLKNIFRNGVIYGALFFALSFILSHFFGLSLKDNLIISISIGLAALLVNGLTYGMFRKSKNILEALTLATYSPDVIRFQSAANYMIEDSMTPGKLFLTDTDLVFKMYEANEERAEFLFSLTSLQSFNFFQSLFNSGGEFMAKDAEGRQFVFEVDELKPWKKAITNTRTVAGIGKANDNFLQLTSLLPLPAKPYQNLSSLHRYYKRS